jgi:hypothetical protein
MPIYSLFINPIYEYKSYDSLQCTYFELFTFNYNKISSDITICYLAILCHILGQNKAIFRTVGWYSVFRVDITLCLFLSVT